MTKLDEKLASIIVIIICSINLLILNEHWSQSDLEPLLLHPNLAWTFHWLVIWSYLLASSLL